MTIDFLKNITGPLEAAVRVDSPYASLPLAEWPERNLALALSRATNVPFYGLDSSHADMDAFSALSDDCVEERFIPLFLSDSVAVVATAEPWHSPHIYRMRRILEREVRMVCVTESDIDQVLASCAQSDFSRSKPATGTNQLSLAPVQSWALYEDDQQNGSLRTVSDIINEAFRLGSSDIHFDPEKNRLRIRFRIDNDCVVMPPISGTHGRKIIDAVKVKASISTSESASIQKGRISEETPYGSLDLRVEVCPSLHGQSIVCRLLDPKKLRALAKSLPFYGRQLDEVVAALETYNGLILMVGPTGSGKTTTLLRMLMRFNAADNVICTIEDPVEYQMPNLRQVDCSRGKVGFHEALKSMLRQDPDVILVGEIRDLETAETAIHGAQTGHLLLSTLHTDTSTQAIDRLLSMGCKFSDVAGNVTLIIAQRLVQRLCSKCKVSVPTPPDVAAIFKSNQHVVPEKICTPKGCVHCSGFGKVGRLPVMEVFAMTQELREMLTVGFKEFELRQKWRAGGGQTLGDYALNLVAQGEVDIRDTATLLLD